MQIPQIVELIEKDLQSIQYKSVPENLYQPIHYSLKLAGKRMRPLLVAMTYGMYQEDIQNALPLCRCIEVFHNFTLLHDDIMDKAPLRRGQPTVYKKWNENIAILSGDVMLVQAYQYLNDLKTDKLSELITIFNNGAVKVCEGQQYDMNFEDLGEDEVQVEDYIEMIYLKTAALLDHAMEMAAVFAGAPEGDIQNLKLFAKNIGLAFQLKDDLLDAFGDTEKFGKQAGGDILANKKTFLLLKAMELANPDQKQKLQNWLNTDENPDQKVTEVIHIFKEIGIPQITEQLIKKYFLEGIEALRSISSQREEKEILASYVEKLMDREN